MVRNMTVRKDWQEQRCVKKSENYHAFVFFVIWNFGWFVSRSRTSFSSLVLFLRNIREFTRLPQNEAHISWSEWGITYIAVCLGETKNEGGKLKFDSVTLSHWTHSVIFLFGCGKTLTWALAKKKSSSLNYAQRAVLAMTEVAALTLSYKLLLGCADQQ